MTATIKLRRGTAAAWTSANPILHAGEAGYETDTGKIKFGDGTTTWNALAYFAPGGAPSGTAGGDLTGTYPNPTLGSGAFGTPSVALGTAAVAGSSSDAVRTDSTIVAFDATVPSTQAFGDTASAGVAAVAARRDHKHAMPATPTSVSGNAGTATALQTARTIDGVSFDGTANITTNAESVHAATSKATPVDADETLLVDSAASNVLKKLTWLNVKATLKTYFDTLYTAIGASAPPNGSAGGDLTGTYPNPTLAAAGPGATGPLGSATVAPIVTIDAKGRVTALSSATISSPGGLAVYGDGSDGTVTFDGTTTILGIVPNPNSASVGVYTLARDIFLANGSTLNSGISIVTAGFRIFCAGTFTNNGTIRWNGTNATANSAVAGTSLSNANSPINNTTGGAGNPSTAGGAGGALGAAGSNGVAGTAAGFGGVGGVGGNGTSGSGGNGGTQTALVATQGSVRAVPFALIGKLITGTQSTVQNLQGGTGGGGGAADASNTGAGGGAGGGIVIVCAKVFAGTGAIQARGGDGSTRTAGNVGGGGGGGGGLVIVVSSSVVAGVISGQTIDANGGAKGLLHGSGTDGSNGNLGTTIILPN